MFKLQTTASCASVVLLPIVAAAALLPIMSLKSRWHLLCHHNHTPACCMACCHLSCPCHAVV